MRIILLLPAMLCWGAFISGCGRHHAENTGISDVAANEEVANYMRSFVGQGEQADDSSPLRPMDALARFTHPTDIRLELVLAEPDVCQPVFMKFDHRGRLWVVQYNQYPYPAGLKITGIDNHARMTFDAVPSPPPLGVKGADKVTIYEDTDDDGRYDKATDAISGLNIATSVALGRGQIWVLSPPYLLAYPDPDGDGLPNGNPEVHLRGFGLEDTHAVANSLRWGPDGWLYGAQGSTVTANVSSAVSKNVFFSGQAIWRYHPETRIFEIFAEGGGNTFYIEIDSKGRLYSGDNNTSRGQYFKQGGYYIKSWGKHGALTNPYAFGYLPQMGLDGDSMRFTHAWVKYEENHLPGRYHGAMIAVNPLNRYLQLSRFEPNGSNFNTVDATRILETDDRWFRPVDIKAGPDGAVYIADWYDSRLSHVNPRDDWHKSSGRIYRISAANKPLVAMSFNLSTYSNQELLGALKSKDRWLRQEALQQFGNRKNADLIPPLLAMLRGDNGQAALEALWAINLSGGFNEQVAEVGLRHENPYVRLWTIRLLGDQRQLTGSIEKAIISVAAGEPHPEVRSQLASTAKRVQGPVALNILKSLLLHHEDAADPDIPLLVWWALESKAESDREAVLTWLGDKKMWERAVVKTVILKRLIQRYVMAGGAENLAACARLLELAPEPAYAEILLNGLQEGMRGTDYAQFPPVLTRAVETYGKEIGVGSFELAFRLGDKSAIQRAIRMVADEQTDLSRRLALIRAFGEVSTPSGVPTLLALLARSTSPNEVQIAILRTLERYNDPTISQEVMKLYPDRLRAYPEVREAALSLMASREQWAEQLLKEIRIGGNVSKSDFSHHVIQRLQLMESVEVNRLVNKHWPDIQLVTSAEKSKKVNQVLTLLKSRQGNAKEGKAIYRAVCGACHRLFGEGGEIGPELTGYDRSNLGDLLINTIDPSAIIREGFGYYHFQTTDGRNIIGKVISQKGQAYHIQSLSGDTLILNAAQLTKMEPHPKSVMPERLLDGLTDQQISDLFAYITQIDKRP